MVSNKLIQQISRLLEERYPGLADAQRIFSKNHTPGDIGPVFAHLHYPPTQRMLALSLGMFLGKFEQSIPTVIEEITNLWTYRV